MLTFDEAVDELMDWAGRWEDDEFRAQVADALRLDISAGAAVPSAEDCEELVFGVADWKREEQVTSESLRQMYPRTFALASRYSL